MEVPAYERLSAQDRAFLEFERPGLPMHLGAVTILEGGPLVGADGAVDLAALRAHIRARLHLAPRYRQRLAWVPLLQRPVWVDDAHFDLRHHVRRAKLPKPAGADALKRLAGRLFSRPIDRAHPLWEMWLIDGLGEGRFALIQKTHHAMADGISAFDLFAALLSATPEVATERPLRWRPRPLPAPMTLLLEQIAHEIRAPAHLGRELAQTFSETLAHPAQLAQGIAVRARAVAGLLSLGLIPPAETPLNQPVGPQRQFDWLVLDLAEAKRVKMQLGGTVNDVILATVAGALRRFLGADRADARVSDYRVVVPVNVRSTATTGRTDNRVSAWLTSLPLGEADPVARLRLVQGATARLKGEGHALGPDLLMRVAEGIAPGLVGLGVRLVAWLHPYNLIVSNVSGPTTPLYLRGARLRAAYPQVPLFEHQGFGVGIFSVDGSLCWGFHADPELVPDLPRLVAAVSASFAELRQAAAGAGPAISTRARRSWSSTRASSANSSS